MNAAAKFVSKYRLYIAPAAFFGGLAGYPPATFEDHRAYWVAACFSSLMMGVYLLNKVSDLDEDEHNPNARPIARNAARPVFAIAVLLLFLPPIYLWSQRAHFWLYVVITGLGLWYCYRIPLFSRRIRLKDVLVVKNVVTAVSWAAVLILCPALLGMPTEAAFVYFAKVFAILMIIGITWDVRDMQGDAHAGVRTIPIAWGMNATKVVCVVCLMLLGTTGLLVPDNEITFWPTVVATLVAILLLSPAWKRVSYQLIGWLWAFDTVAVLLGWRSS